jgi:hypothetical protein
MTNKIIGTICAILVVLAGAGLFWVEMQHTATAPTATDMHWQFTDRGTDNGLPHTAVVLAIKDKTYDLGIHIGSCTVIDGTTWQLQPGELSGAICYFAGGGDELGVFKEGAAYVIKSGPVDEGSAETPGTRGPYTITENLP